MNNIKAIGTSMLLLALIGLSGCDKNGTTVVPAAENTTENTTAADDAYSDQQADTALQSAIASNNLPVESQTASDDDAADENASNDETAAPEGSSVSDAAGALTYRAIPIANSAHAMTNNGRNLVYGTVDGLIYSLNPNTGNSTFLYDVNTHIPDILIGGLAYIGGSQYYYSAAHASTINRLDIENGTSEEIAGGLFPDGIDLYHNKIYSVTDDRSEVLTVFDTDGHKLYTLSTGIDDMVAIAHTDKYLYILSEDGDVYQTDSSNGNSHLIVDNSGFEEGDSFGGVEAIDILNHRIYLSNVNDSTVYEIDVDVRSFE